jgi:hypothetical protein
MYISKWWGNLVGGSDDALALVDYFESRDLERFTLREILRDLSLDKYLGKTTLRESKDLSFPVEFPDGQSFENSFMISIDPVIDLCAVLLECARSGRVHTRDLFPSSKRPVVFGVDMEKEPLKLLLDELALFCSEPLSYDLAELVPESDMLELADACREIESELQAVMDSLAERTGGIMPSL